MNLKDYQEFTRTTAIYPKESAIVYCSLGLMNEAGEVGGKIKKCIRDKNSDFNDIEFIANLSDEVGDVLWYATRLLDELGINIEDVFERNQSKLQSRKERNVLSGSGDRR